MFDFAARFDQGLAYNDFLARHGSPEHQRRWAQVRQQVQLAPEQEQVLRSFRREMKVLCLAGAWCGDCVNQCPIFDRFAELAPSIQLRFFDRDQHGDLAAALSICGGARVPVVVFLSEDGKFCGLYGDRTLATYRKLGGVDAGGACATGLGVPATMLQSVTQDWLNEFERVQWMLITSPRLRQLHGE